MTKEEREKAIATLDDMKVKIDIPKSAKIQIDKNWALDIAIKALSEESKLRVRLLDELEAEINGEIESMQPTETLDEISYVKALEFLNKTINFMQEHEPVASYITEESKLDKIVAEIKEACKHNYVDVCDVLSIINKYRESEE